MKRVTEQQLDRLFALARSDAPEASPREACFEGRVMAHILERRRTQPAWCCLVWRMVPVFAVIAAISAIGSLSFSLTPSRPGDLFAVRAAMLDDAAPSGYLSGE